MKSAHTKNSSTAAAGNFSVSVVAGRLGVTEEDIREKIEQFKLQGCTLFV